MKYIYMFGCKVKADADDKYQLVKISNVEENNKSTDINATGVKVEKVDSAYYRSNGTKVYKNNDGESVTYRNLADAGLYLVNTAGNVQKNKTAAKDGNDWYFYVSGYKAQVYTNNKTVKSNDNNISDWKDLK